MQALIHSKLAKYFLIAAIIVVIELAVFQLVYLTYRQYVIATTISFAVAVIINWLASRNVVFGASTFSKKKEFILVAAVSIVGLGIQLGVGYAAITIFHLYPLLGKILSIFLSFFWNYWFREHFIFAGSKDADTEEVIERIDTSLY